MFEVRPPLLPHGISLDRDHFACNIALLHSRAEAGGEAHRPPARHGAAAAAAHGPPSPRLLPAGLPSLLS